MTGEVSAAELMARLQADPMYQKKQAEKTAKRLADRAHLEVEEQPLVRDLKTVGCHVNSVWDLVNTTTPYPKTVNILLAHLKRPYPDRVREGIARALAVPDAASAWRTLKSEYEKSIDGSGVKSGLAAALSAISNENVIQELAELAKDVKNGSSRLILLVGLKRSLSIRISETLKELRNDPVLKEEIVSWDESS